MNIKKISICFGTAALAVGLLTGCGKEEAAEPGDIITLENTISGSDTIQTYNNMVESIENGGKWVVDGEKMNTLFEGDQVEVVSVNKKEKFTLVQELNEFDDEDFEYDQWWVVTEALLQTKEEFEESKKNARVIGN